MFDRSAYADRPLPTDEDVARSIHDEELQQARERAYEAAQRESEDN
jgi:hypothetical protein